MTSTEQTTTGNDLRAAWQTWHDERETSLAEPHGWLSLTALHWLTAQPASLPGLPGRWRVRDADTVELDGVTPADDVRLPDVDGPVDGSATLRPVDGAPGVMVTVGERVVEIARRTDDYALRVRDPQAVTRTAFSGVPVWPVDERWVVPARFTPYDEPETITVDAVVDGLHHYPTAVGTVTFELGGQSQSLVALRGKDGGLSLHFRDATSGQASYGGGRILRTDDPEPDGSVVLDLNRTVNLPCAFVAHATCPLPPAGNMVTVPVEAGERTPLRPDLAWSRHRTSVVGAPTRWMMPVLVAATVVTISTNSMITVLLPDVGRSLGAGPVALGWTATGALLGLAVGSPVYGVLGQRYGIRAVLAAGLGVFTAGVAVAAVAPDIAVLIVARGLQGVGAGAVPTLAGYAVVTVVEPARRGAAFGVLGSATGVAQVAGPVVGGTLGELVGWRGVFVLAGLVAIPLAVAGVTLLPGRSPAQVSRGIDVAGVLLLAGAVSALLAAINLWGQPTASRAFVGTLLVLGALAALGLVWRSRTAREPFVPPALLRRPGFVPACAVAAVGLGVSVAVEVLVPLQLSDLRGLESGAIGLVMLPGAVVAVAVAAPAGRVADRVGNRAVAAAGVLVMVIGVLALSSTAGGGPVVIAAGTATTELGFVVTGVAAQNAAGAALGPPLASVGLGLFHTARYLSGGIGAAVGPGILEASGAVPQSWNPAHDGAGAGYADTLLLLAPVLLVGLATTARLRRVRVVPASPGGRS